MIFVNNIGLVLHTATRFRSEMLCLFNCIALCLNLVYCCLLLLIICMIHLLICTYLTLHPLLTHHHLCVI